MKERKAQRRKRPATTAHRRPMGCTRVHSLAEGIYIPGRVDQSLLPEQRSTRDRLEGLSLRLPAVSLKGGTLGQRSSSKIVGAIR